MSEAEELRTLRIESVAQGGDGLAREPGQPIVFVPGSAPGDLVRVRLVPTKARAPDFRHAALLEILEAGPGRRAPPCPEAGVCGGCQWQHLRDGDQDSIIRELLLAALRRVGRLEVRDDVVAPTLGLPSRLGYRQRVRVHLAPGTSSPGTNSPGTTFTLGFLRMGSHDVHPVVRCPVAEPGIQDMTERISGRLNELHSVLHACSGELQLDLPEDGSALAFLDVDRVVTREQLSRALDVLAEACPEIIAAEAIGRRQDRGGRGGRARASRGPRSVPYRRGPLDDPRGFAAFASPGGFLQASRAGNALLISRVLETARGLGLPAGARVLELFAGDGNFSLPLAAAGFNVAASDSDERAVENAALALKVEAARVSGSLRVEQASAEAHVRRLASAGEPSDFDIVLLDPPRSGAREVCELIPQLGARAIIMVSCDAATLARDIAILCRAGYSLERVEPLALFPQTAHFETLALLKMTSGPN